MIKNPTVQSDLSWKNIRTHLNHHLHSIYLIEEVQHCHICELNKMRILLGHIQTLRELSYL